VKSDIETGGGVQGGSDSVGEDDPSDEGLETTKPRVWTCGSLVVSLIRGTGSVREGGGREVPVLLRGSSATRLSRIDGGGCDRDKL
jgi:hypothetical protein